MTVSPELLIVSRVPEQIDLSNGALRRRSEPADLMGREDRSGRLGRNSAHPGGTASRSPISVAHNAEMYSAETLPREQLTKS